MARTERVSSTVDRDSMVSEPPAPISVEPTDLRQAAAVSEVARLLDAPEITEYWKSAPYLLNFMRDYALKRLMKEKLRATPSGLREAVARAKPSLLDSDTLDAYEPLEPANGRMRGLMDNVFRDRLEQHLWIPPALPYYGPPRANPPLTKALIFSSWSMVPDAVAALLSYEAERLMGVGKAGQTYFERTRPRPLQFRQDQGRLAGMRAMLLIYPSPKLAELTDPLTIFCRTFGAFVSSGHASGHCCPVAAHSRPTQGASIWRYRRPRLGVGRTCSDRCGIRWKRSRVAALGDRLGVTSKRGGVSGPCD